MNLRPEEISSVIKEQIERYSSDEIMTILLYFIQKIEDKKS